MKKIIALIWVFVFLLTGCSSFPSPDTYADLDDTFYEGIDHPHQFANSFTFFSVTPGENGYYFFYGNTLCFFDKETKDAVPVCNKPECIHQDESCPAFFLRDRRGLLQWYNGKLYVETYRSVGLLKEEVFLYEVDPSAGTRKKLCQLPYAYNTTTQYMMHRGYLYMVNSATELDETTGETLGVYRIERVGLDELKEKSLDPELLFEKRGDAVMPFCLPLLYGNHLVFGVSEEDGHGVRMQVYEYQIDEQRLNETVFPDLEEGAYILFDSIKDGNLIATYVSPEAARWESFETSYYEYDIENKTFTPIMTFPDRGEKMSECLQWDGTHWITVYLDALGTEESFSANQEIRMLNEDFEEIAALPIDTYVLNCVVGDADFMFYGNWFTGQLYAVDKRGEKMELIEIVKAS